MLRYLSREALLARAEFLVPVPHLVQSQRFAPAHLPRLLTRSVLILILLAGVSLSDCSLGAEIITFGTNTVESNAALGLTALRLGCSAPPERCIKAAVQRAKQQGVGKVYLAVRLTTNTPDELSQYPRHLSAGVVLEGVGFDDFVSQYRKLAQRYSVSKAISVMDRATNTPGVRIGVTIYGEGLDSPWLGNAKLPKEIRSRIRSVHLFVRHRSNGVNFQKYVRRARDLFPQAQIFGGVYAYDRRDYSSCNTSSKAPCSGAEELRLFRVSLENELALVKRSELQGLEFYPGDFGREESWKGWNNSKICRNREACISETKKMRSVVLELLQSARK